jgi:hypothetical protein
MFPKGSALNTFDEVQQPAEDIQLVQAPLLTYHDRLPDTNAKSVWQPKCQIKFDLPN